MHLFDKSEKKKIKKYFSKNYIISHKFIEPDFVTLLSLVRQIIAVPAMRSIKILSLFSLTIDMTTYGTSLICRRIYNNNNSVLDDCSTITVQLLSHDVQSSIIIVYEK